MPPGGVVPGLPLGWCPTLGAAGLVPSPQTPGFGALPLWPGHHDDDAGVAAFFASESLPPLLQAAAVVQSLVRVVGRLWRGRERAGELRPRGRGDYRS